MGGLSFRRRLRRLVAKNLSIIIHVLPARLISPARVLPTVGLLRPVPRVRLVRPVRMVRRPVRPVLVALAAREELNGREVFPVLVARPVPVDRAVVPVARPVPVDLVAVPVVLAAHPAQV